MSDFCNSKLATYTIELNNKAHKSHLSKINIFMWLKPALAFIFFSVH